MTFLVQLYRAASALALPFAARRQVQRIRAAGFSVERAHERLGHSTADRPLGPLLWIHGASVGETKSALPLVARMIERGITVLLTSGTATSAQAVAPRLPEGAIHQFAPLDGVGPMRRFLDHWRPDAVVLVESELWPNLLTECAARRLPVALINARLSDSSAQGWKRFPATARTVLGAVRMAHCQDQRTRNHLRDLGLDFARTGVNLKAIQTAPMLRPEALQGLRRALQSRPLWVAASTHEGEETVVLDAHRRLLETHPDLMLILVPRHPERADEVLALMPDLAVAQRSKGQDLDAAAQVYLADTIGEMDLWYSLAPIVFLGGSLVPIGGHTPFEPAAAGCAILHGPLHANFDQVYADFAKAGAALEITDAISLAGVVDRLLNHPEQAQKMAMAAEPLALGDSPALDALIEDVLALTDLDGMTGDD